MQTHNQVNLSKPYNLTICRVCSMFCKNGATFCSDACKSNPTCAMCMKSKAMAKHSTSLCQFCTFSSTSNFTKIRCITCQRRCVAQDINTHLYDTAYFCCKRCSESPQCRTPNCGNKAWLDFGENYALYCLNCLWAMPDTNIADSDGIYGRPTRISLLMKYNDHILVHKRGPDITYPGMISINSGTMEVTDTSSVECTVREIQEEASLDIRKLTNPLIRLSQNLFYVELTEAEFKQFGKDMTQIHTATGFEYEVDEWGYHFMKRGDITYDSTTISIHLKRSLRVYDRFTSYVTKSKDHSNYPSRTFDRAKKFTFSDIRDANSCRIRFRAAEAKIAATDLVQLYVKYESKCDSASVPSPSPPPLLLPLLSPRTKGNTIDTSDIWYTKGCCNRCSPPELCSSR